MQSESLHQIWQEHIKAWEKSGLTQKVFCNELGIKLATFGSWRKRLRTSNHENISFIKANPPAHKEGSPGKVMLHIVLPNGVRLGLNEGIKESLLHQVLHFAGAL